MEIALSERELQQWLQRFTTQFTDRIIQATEVLEQSSNPGIRDQALRKTLLYFSSALEIATGPFPAIDLLDMIVFVRLSRASLEEHWVPTLYAAEGVEMVEVFAKSEQDLWEMAGVALGTEQRDQLMRLIDDWRAENPRQVRVEGIRLSDFSTAAGNVAAARAAQAKGLLSSVKTATQTANQALHLSERGLFLLHRLPFLWRLQVRLAARELLGDALKQAQQVLGFARRPAPQPPSDR
jgi:hypothetical protein